MSKILDKLYAEIDRFDSDPDKDLTPDEQEYVNALWLAAELIAETNFVIKDPKNWARHDEITADELLGEKPGDPVYRYPLTRKGSMGLMLLDLDENIGKWVRRRRERAGMSRYQLAKKIKCTIPSITNWEDGKQVPRFDKVFEIFQATK